jgi:hypothetical protein
MKRVFLIIICCLASQIGAYAQSEDLPPCPKISVAGPSGIIDPASGEPVTYTAEVENSEHLSLEYLWETTSGKIISGQGTLSIELLVRENDNPKIAVTVEIKGLPKHCPNSFTEEQVVLKREPHNCLETYRKLSWREEYSEMDNVMIRLRQASAVQVVFYLSFRGKPTQRQIDARILRMLKAFVIRRRLDELKNRIAFVIVQDKEEYTRICYFSESEEEIDFNNSNVIKAADVNLKNLSKSKKPKR